MAKVQREVWEEIFSNEPYSLGELIEGNKWVSVKHSPLLYYVIKNLGLEKNILEAGCGKGQWVIYLNNLDYKIFGIDFAIKTIQKTKALYPGLNLVGGDINQLCFNDNSFDIILCWSVLDHIESGPLNALKEIYRIMKPGGLLFITVPCRNLFYQWSQPLLFLKEILRKNRLLRKILKKSPVKKDFFQNEFTVQEFLKYQRKIGLRIKKIDFLGYETGLVNGLQRLLGSWSNFIYKKDKNGRWLGLTRLGNLICRAFKNFSPLITPDEIFCLSSKDER